MNKQNMVEATRQHSATIKATILKMLRYEEYGYEEYLLFFIVAISIIFVSGTLEIDRKIADKSEGYFVHKNIKQANEAGRLGYVKYEVNDYAEVFGIPWSPPKSGVRSIIRSGPDDFDDIGYISFLQLIAIAGKKITITFLEELHNYAFVISLIVLSFVVSIACKNILAGWIFLGLGLILKADILSLVYGSPDSRTFVIVFPFLVISMFFGLNWLGPYLNKLWGWAGGLILSFGLVIGIMTSIRDSEGFMALCAVLLCIGLLKAGRRGKALSIATILLGNFLITIVMPIAFALHRDIRTGEFTGDIKPYLQTTGSHPTVHSILLGVGRYPNSLGMKFQDVACYEITRSKYPEAVDPILNFQGKGYWPAIRAIYLEYVVTHPLEYLKNLTRASAEMILYYIPYATSAGNLYWCYGYLPIKPGTTPAAMDLAPTATNLINIRYEYLRLSLFEWGTYILAILTIVLAIKLSLSGAFGRDNKNIFLSTSFYMLMLAGTRTLIPYHGLSLITCFWMFSIMSLLYLFFIDNAVRDLVYLKYVKGLNLLSTAAEPHLRLPVGLGGLKRLNLSEFYIPGAVVLFGILVVGVIIQLHKLEVSVKGLRDAIRQEETAIQGETVKQSHEELEVRVGKLAEVVRQVEAIRQPHEELEARVGKLAEAVRQVEAIKRLPTPQRKFKEVEGFSNGSFESWVETPEGQLLPGGFTYYQDGSGGSAEKNTLEVGLKEGETSVLLRPSSSGNSFIRFEVPSFRELRGHVVRLGMWVKSQNKIDGAIQIDVQDGVTPTVVESYNGRGNWQWLEIETEVHERAKYLYITCNIRYDATDAVYLDGMKLEFYEEK